VLAHIVAAGDMGQGFGQVAVSQLVEPVTVPREVPGNAIEVPGAAKVEAVEVNEFAVGTILHLSGLKVEVRAGQSGQEFDQPGMVRGCGQDSPHQVGFFEGGTKEVIAAGFPGNWVIGIVLIKPDGGPEDGSLQRIVFGAGGVVPGKPEREGEVGMFAYPNGIVHLGEIGDEKPGYPVGQRGDIAAKLLTKGVVPGEEFVLKLKEPGPAVGAFEAFIVFGAEDAHFAADVGGGEVFFQFFSYFFSAGCGGEEFEEADEHPVAMYAGVPVVAAIESRVVKAGFHGEGTIGEGDSGLVREFALHATEG